MNIKSLLLGSAAALAVVSGAQAADAIVAAEPEPMEYVRVCDAFGTGFFYIPGTETCLRISGEVRTQVVFGNDAAFNDGGLPGDRNWESGVRARVNFDSRSDSEVGTIGTRIRVQGNIDSASQDDVTIDEAFITVGGFRVGRAYSFWDDVGIAGENDAFTGNTDFNLASYTYTSDAFSAGLGVDDLSDLETGYEDEIGVQGMVSASLGAATVAVYGVYDFGAEEGAIAAELSAAIGPGTLELYGAYSSGANTYVAAVEFPSGAEDSLEWTIGAAYAFKATEKFTITPSVNYWEFQAGTDAWGAGLLAEYAVATGLTASATVDYFDADGEDEVWTGFVRLTRSF